MKTAQSRNIAESFVQPRVIYVVTSSLGVRFLRGQLGYLRKVGFDVIVISSPGEELTCIGKSEGVQVIPLAMRREISPLRDLISLCHLWVIMRRLRPSLTNVGTPKAGLLGGLAAFLAGVPCRLYTLYGLRLETSSGMQRRLLLFAERLSCLCAHRVICVSDSLRQKAVALGLVKCEQTAIFGSGSCNGVDVSRFELDQEGYPRVYELRRKLGIPEEAPVVGFVGRFTRDKGIVELVKAFSQLCETSSVVWLLLVGDFEDGDPLPPDIRRAIETNPKIIRTGWVPEATLYYHLMDVLALPTYREGFPNVVLEAHAAGKPVIATRATGVVDAMVDGVTGIMVPVGDVAALAKGLESLLGNKGSAAAMGGAGRERVQREFQQEKIWGALAQEYSQLLRARGLPPPKVETKRVASAATEGPSVVQS